MVNARKVAFFALGFLLANAAIRIIETMGGSAMTEEELEEMLERVPGSHEHFVEGVLSDAEEFGAADGIARFIRENPGLGAGYVAEHSAKLAGLM